MIVSLSRRVWDSTRFPTKITGEHWDFVVFDFFYYYLTAYD